MAGQDKFAKISTFYCKGAGAAILAYDITDSNSFIQLPSYVETVKSSQADVSFVIIGTKYDLVEENPEMRQVSTMEAKIFADGLNAPLFETSARSNINVQEVFDHVGFKKFPILLSQRPMEDSPIISQGANAQQQASSDVCCCIQ
jgi:GTPase SAR1 family protein